MHSLLDEFLFSLFSSLFFYSVTLPSKLCNVLQTPLLSIPFSLHFKNGFQTEKQQERTIQLNQSPDKCVLISKILLPSLFHPVYNFVQSSNDFIFSTSQFETMSRSLGHIFQNICEILVLTVKTKALLNQFRLALYGQARSSIPRNMPLMNSSFESLNPWCIDATSIKFKYTFLHS